MPTTPQQDVVNFIVCSQAPGKSSVFEQGFEQPIAEFTDVETAEKYALRIAETKAKWKVDVYDEAGKLIGTYNSEDDAMPKPAET